MNLDNPLHRYHLGKKIGTGGMASVFLARDTILNRDVAIKMVHPHLLQNTETLRRFSNEAQAIAALSHDNIIKIYDYGKSGDLPFIVMEYVEGCTLETLLAREGSLPSLVTLEIARQMLAGLICAHDKGIYHRDIKPGNVLIDGEGRLRISDFGIAYLVNAESITLTGSFLGSPHFISPEQVSNGKVRDVTDIFSLGILLYQCLTGVFPFDADTPHGTINSILTTEPPAPAVVNRRLLLWLSDSIESFLEKDPSRRPSAREASGRLEASCRREVLQCGRERLGAFLKNAQQVRDDELRELRSHYRTRAHNSIRERQVPSALRNFEQAGRFGALGADDEKIIARISRQSVTRRALLIVAAFLVVAALLYPLLIVTGTHRQVPGASSAAPDGAEMAGSFTSDTLNVSRTPVEPVRLAPIVDTPRNVFGPKSATRDDAPAVHSPRLPDTLEKTLIKPAPDTVARRQAEAVASPGFFTCFTNPPWVNIYIDGIERGKTPTLSAVPLSSGKHVVRLSRLNYTDYGDTIVIAPAETVHVRVKLVSQLQGTSVP